ncbi:DUF3558 domain-containing protein [Saccharomonospora azurea]|uniref:DUF3558 domain-containing protein n=1 Tax=Saccharomonospora azurea TaxID=40988 RepID=UPI003D928AB6
MKRMMAGLGVGFVALTVAGCSGETGGEPAPRPESSMAGSALPTPATSGAPPELPHSGAPAVVDPLPESVLPDDPCDVLTSQQIIQALGSGASEGERSDLEPVGPGCHWSNEKTLSSLQVGFNTVARQGLSATYANAKPQSAVFREVSPIQDLPAVAYKDSEDDRVCTVVVGLADDYTITSTVGLSAEKEAEGVDSCVPAEMVAEMVVGNLKAKAGE